MKSKEKISRSKREELRVELEADEKEFFESSGFSKYRLENASPDGLHEQRKEQRKNRTRSPISIPTRCSKYKLITFPEIKLKYKVPGYPECYLLPIRFPKLHQKIIASLLYLKSSKRFKPKNVVIAQ